MYLSKLKTGLGLTALIFSITLVGFGSKSNGNSSNDLAKELAGVWVSESEPIVGDNINALRVDASGKMTFLSVIAEDEIHAANLAADGLFVYTKLGTEALNKKLGGGKVENIQGGVEKVNADKIAMKFLSGTYNGISLNFEDEEPSYMVRTTETEIAALKNEVLLGLIQTQ